MTKTDNNSPPPLSRGQFSLLGLLSFTLAWSLYFSAIAVFAKMLPELHYPNLPAWSSMLSLCFAWAVLALLYRRWRLRLALIVHCSGPIMAMVLCLSSGGTWMVGRHLSNWEIVAVQEMFGIVSLGCFIGVLISLPIATLMLAYQVLTRSET